MTQRERQLELAAVMGRRAREERDEIYIALLQAIHVTGIHTTGDGWIYDWLGSRIRHKDDNAELYSWLEHRSNHHANNPE